MYASSGQEDELGNTVAHIGTDGLGGYSFNAPYPRNTKMVRSSNRQAVPHNPLRMGQWRFEKQCKLVMDELLSRSPRFLYSISEKPLSHSRGSYGSLYAQKIA